MNKVKMISLDFFKNAKIGSLEMVNGGKCVETCVDGVDSGDHYDVDENGCKTGEGGGDCCEE